MSPAELCRQAGTAGLTLRADGDSLVVRPADRLTPDLRSLLTDHKPEVLTFLHETERTTVLLLQAAMRACDAWSDPPAAREQMRREVLTPPPEQHVELLEHFQEQYGDAQPQPANEPEIAEATARMCRACAHRLRAGTCSEPVAAGLAEAFTVVWPPAGHGAGCPAFRRLGSDAKGAAR